MEAARTHHPLQAVNPPFVRQLAIDMINSISTDVNDRNSTNGCISRGKFLSFAGHIILKLPLHSKTPMQLMRDNSRRVQKCIFETSACTLNDGIRMEAVSSREIGSPSKWAWYVTFVDRIAFTSSCFTGPTPSNAFSNPKRA